MKNIIFIGLLLALLIACDAIQKANGYVFDKETKEPIDSVAISKFEKEDTANPYSRRIYSEKNGEFHFNGIGMTNEVKLYFMKPGYKTLTRKYGYSAKVDTVYLEKQ